MRISKRLLMASAICALSIGTASQKASAFEDVDWDWELTVVEDINIGIDGNAVYDPTGVLKLEKIQVSIGDLSATSTVDGVSNNPPVEGGGTTTFSETIDLQALFDDNAEGNPITSIVVNNPDLEASNPSGNVDNNAEQVNLTFDLTGEVPVVGTESLDAVDLPSVVSTATAVANNQVISSDVSLGLHDAQFAFGGFSDGLDNGPFGNAQVLSSGGGHDENAYTDALAAATLAAALGIITPATITADSSVSNIVNASVDSAATALSNNMDVEVNATTPGDAFALADVTQFSYADITASSSVNTVDVNNYTNFGGAGMGPLAEAQIPLVSSVATAVGNNMAIRVSAPSVDAGL